MEMLLSLEAWLFMFTLAGLGSLVTLTLMEIVLGIDNIIVTSIVAGKLPLKQQSRARQIGLTGALLLRLVLLGSIAWIQRFTEPLFSLVGHSFTVRDLILLGGGLFLIYKAVKEIYYKVEGHHEDSVTAKGLTLTSAVTQITVLNLVFSLDSVITAIGMSSNLPVMVTAVVISVAVMGFASAPISGFVDRHPAVKLLALSFLLLIGVVLVADGIGQHMEKGVIYSTMGFSLMVILLLVRMNSRQIKK